MKNILFLFSLLVGLSTFSQKTEQQVLQHRAEHLASILDTANSILNTEELNDFKGLDYFPFDSTYQVTAKFTKSKGRKFEMPTSTERKAVYRRYGFVDFKIGEEAFRLTVYQNISLKKNPDYRDYLFLPFRDATSSHSTYGGGRYLDLRIPEGKTILLDFNLAYNPYCAYSYRYSCPIPPKENTLSVPIKAGEKIIHAH